MFTNIRPTGEQLQQQLRAVRVSLLFHVKIYGVYTKEIKNILDSFLCWLCYVFLGFVFNFKITNQLLYQLSYEGLFEVLKVKTIKTQ